MNCRRPDRRTHRPARQSKESVKATPSSLSHAVRTICSMDCRSRLAQTLLSIGHPDTELLAASIELGMTRIEAHPLGMYACRTPIADGGEVRLHLWTADSAVFEDDLGRIHDHTWDLASTVLKGRLANSVLDVSEDGPAVHEVWEHDYAQGSLTSSGRPVSLDLASCEHIGESGSYTLAAGRLHVTERATPALLTIVRARPTHRQIARIVSPRARQPRSPQRRSVSLDEFSFRLNTVLAA